MFRTVFLNQGSVDCTFCPSAAGSQQHLTRNSEFSREWKRGERLNPRNVPASVGDLVPLDTAIAQRAGIAVEPIGIPVREMPRGSHLHLLGFD